MTSAFCRPLQMQKVKITCGQPGFLQAAEGSKKGAARIGP